MFFLVKSSFFLTLARLVIPLSDFLDALIIPHQLRASGLGVPQATAVFGEISGMASMIVYMPVLVASALSYTLAPKIAADWLDRPEQFRRRSRDSLQMVWLWGAAGSAFMFAFAEPLSRLFFNSQGPALAIRWMALSPLFGSLRDLSTTILWSMDRRRMPLNGLLLGIICSVLFNLIFISRYGYCAAAAGLLVLDIVSALYNVAALQKESKGLFRILPLLPQTMALCGMVLLCGQLRLWPGLGGLSGTPLTLASMLAACVGIGLFLGIRYAVSGRKSFRS